MKQLLMIFLLASGAAAFAQAPTQAAKAEKDMAKAEADRGKAEAQREADEAKTRAKLEEARERLDKAARDVAELSTQLGTKERREFIFIDGDNNGPRRAVLGVQIDPASGKEGARVRNVSPGGAAEEAGLLMGDVIVALDGKPVVGGENAARALVDQMSNVKPDQKVKVRVLRSGKNKDLIVVARPMMFATNRMFGGGMPGPDAAMAGVMGSMPQVHAFRAIWPGEFGGMELASITPKLGAYFGATTGVLVVQAPEQGAFKLEDGDVIQSIDGRKPEDGSHAMRILRSYQSGEKLNIAVLRQRKPLTLAVTMPEHPEFGDQFMTAPIPPIPPLPPMPPTPATPASGAAGTLE